MTSLSCGWFFVFGKLSEGTSSHGGRLSEKYLIDNQLRGPDSSSTLKKADETNLK